MCPSDKPRLILASSSPRRRELLAEAGYQFDVIAPPHDEPDDLLGRLALARQAEALAYFKARSVHDAWPDRWVLGCDTIVAARGHVMGKARDEHHARRMLRALSTTPHDVISGLAVLAGPSSRIIAADVTRITMRPMTEAEIDDYIASGEWIGKAGAYAIQETADRFVVRVEGSFSNVVGLPMELLERVIHELQTNPDKHRFP
jgi:septum formation protein